MRMEALVKLLSENLWMVQCPLPSQVCMVCSHASFHWRGRHLLDAHHSQGHFMDKNQVPSLKETTVYLTSFTSLLSLAGRTRGIKKLLYKLYKISWNIQGLPVSDEEMVRGQVHEPWEYQVRRNYTTTIISNSNNSRSSSLDQSHIIWCFLMLSFHISDFC